MSQRCFERRFFDGSYDVGRDHGDAKVQHFIAVREAINSVFNIGIRPNVLVVYYVHQGLWFSRGVMGDQFSLRQPPGTIFEDDDSIALQLLLGVAGVVFPFATE